MTELSIESCDRLDAIGQSRWNDLWARSEVPSVFARFEWASAWWQSFGDKSRLRIFVATRQDELVGLLPTIWSDVRGRHRIGLVGEEHADYAGILTDPKSPEAFPGLLDALLGAVPGGSKIELADVRSDTSYFGHLNCLTQQKMSSWTSGEEMVCPRTSLQGERAMELANKSSLRRKARKLAALGKVVVEHQDSSADIGPLLPAFFEQHVERWSRTSYPSLFLKEDNKAFYAELTRQLAESELLIFTEIVLDGDPVACHFGFVSEGDFIWYKPSFSLQYAKVSPGEVLIRELLLLTKELGVSGFDFTRGDEAFKLRFAEKQRFVRTFVCHPSRTAALQERYTATAKDIARKYLPDRLIAALKGLASRGSRGGADG